MKQRNKFMCKSDNQSQPNEYNKVPVLYCRHCLSLAVLSVPKMTDSDFCDSCGSTDIAEVSIEEWEDLYKTKFGHKYLENY